MAIFGRKKPKEEEIKKEIKLPVKERLPVKPAVAELYVKLERYEKVLNSLNDLKATMTTIKNAFSILNELNKVREDNLRKIQNTIENVEKKLMALDSEFVRPSGYEEVSTEVYGTEGLDSELTELQEKVSQLKTELKSMT